MQDPEHILDSCRIKGGDEGGSGSWRVASKLRPDGDAGFENVIADYPDYIANSPTATVQTFDRRSGGIVVNISKRYNDGGRYVARHKGTTDEPSSASMWIVSIEEGNLFILDPKPDDWTSRRAYAALEHTDSNALYDLLDAAFSDGRAEQFER